MATINEQIVTTAAPEKVWDALRDVGEIHTRLAPGFVVDTVLEPDARARIVTFGNGLVARELIVDVDDDAHRLAYAVVDSEQLTHHNGVFTVEPDGTGARITWRADLLPDEMLGVVAGMMAQGMAVMRETMDRA